MKERTSIVEKELFCPYEQGNLYGVLYTPEKCSEKLPAVIVSHGIYSSYQMTSDTAKELAKEGFATYIFDFKGCSYSNKSGGDILKSSILTEKNELISVIEFIKKQSIIDSERIFLLGQSMGGVVSALAAVDKVEDIRGLVLMYPALMANEFATSFFKTIDEVPEVVEKFMGTQGLNVGKIFFEDIMNTDVKKEIAKFEKPVYIISGTEDKVVPIQTLDVAVGIYKDAILKKVQGAEHGFNLSPTQASEIADFLEDC